uniref:Dehydrogenase/reductase 2 n=1 Tax=Marmota marmota marmota TaxID=9994 RepID=A0A8C5ZJ42_MARMA
AAGNGAPQSSWWRQSPCLLFLSVTPWRCLSHFISFLGLGAYNVSKTALLGLTKTLAVELAPKNIRVNCLVPGFIKTDFSQVVSTEKNFEEYWKKIFGMQRVGKPEECAGLVSFLCSPDASYITGENIVIAGFSPRL